ncbi:flagellar biosynthesis protein FlhF [Rosettibacter firmus]|uniref:flagellar biosynthesis protein FlhF n=1 Tax=Rosettibacter firmus TaxID=3111522 RepID=UPI00336C135E
MQIKKFIAPTLKEATEKMKNELGGEAIILGTRVIEGDRRFNNKKMYEITAGIDNDVKVASDIKEEYDLNQNKSLIESEIEKLTKKIFSHNNFEPDTKSQFKKSTSTNLKIDKELDDLYDLLIEREVQKNIANTLINQLKNYDGLLGEVNLESYLIAGMSSLIHTKEFKVKKNKTTKVALVGPTGVGKTTCIAKLAVISKIIHKLKVGLISIDTYRLGAIDQLRIFSEISDIEMAVAYEPGDMQKLIKKFKNKDLIFIDTVGRSQRNADNLNKIKEYLDEAEVDETILVLSSTSSYKTLYDVAQKFKVLNYSSVIFSKIDEAVTYGNLLNLSHNFNLPITFLTNGQVIPDDIISVNSEYLANLIYKGKLY